MNKLFRQEVVEERKHRLTGVVSLVQPSIFKYLTYLIVLIVIGSIIFLSLGEYTRKQKVSGFLQPDTGMLKLEANQAGIITEILVHEGQYVFKDQPLLRISSEKHGVQGFELNQSIINQYEAQVSGLKQQIIDQKTKQELEVSELNNRTDNLVKQLVELELQQNIFQKRVYIKRKIVQQVTKLSGTGFISSLEVMRQQDSLLDFEQQMSKMDAEKQTIMNQIEQNKNLLSQLPITQAQTINIFKTQLLQAKMLLATIEQQKLSELRASAEGTITGMLAKTGNIVDFQQHLLSILPKASVMQAIIYIPTSAFGFVEEGLQIRIRFHAFPYQRFGIYEGEIAQISANVILPTETGMPGIITEPSYRVIVALKSQTIDAYGREHPLRSGMKLDGDIVIDKRSLLRWLFDPVFSIKG